MSDFERLVTGLDLGINLTLPMVADAVLNPTELNDSVLRAAVEELKKDPSFTAMLNAYSLELHISVYREMGNTSDSSEDFRAVQNTPEFREALRRESRKRALES